MRYLIPVLMMLICSCNPTQRAINKVNAVNKRHPEVLANFCRDTFPCVTSKIDTVTTVEYDFVEVQCPGYDYDNALVDTVWLTFSKTQLIEGPTVIATEYKTNTITKVVKDSAAIRSCELELISCNNKCNDLIQQNNKLQNKVTAKNRWIMWLIIALLLSIMCNIIQLKK